MARGIIFAAVLAAAALAAPALPLAFAGGGDDEGRHRKEADRHFKNGVKLFQEQKYAEALAEFEQAYALEPHPLVLYNLAGAHRALSQYDQAVDFYNRFLREGEGEVSRKKLAQARKELDALLELVARVRVTTRPAGARVVVDGREIGETPLTSTVALGPGDHVVEATLEGHQKSSRRFRVAAGDQLQVDLVLEAVEDVEASSAEAEASLAGEIPPPRFGVSAAYGTNALEAADVGAPVVGLGYAFTDRLSAGLDVVLVAYAAIPEIRYRLFGDALSLHGVAALPVSFRDGSKTGTFASAAGGLGVRYRPTRMLAVRLETWLSYGGSEHGTTLPAFAAAELWF